jgi:hypothetical protein
MLGTPSAEAPRPVGIQTRRLAPLSPVPAFGRGPAEGSTRQRMSVARGPCRFMWRSSAATALGPYLPTQPEDGREPGKQSS